MENNSSDYNPSSRFNDRVKNYSKFRPDYPEPFIDFLESTLHLDKSMCFADIGSGTGLFAKHLLSRGYKVICVEPNIEMRDYAEHYFSGYPNFFSKNGKAEDTGINSQSIDCIFVAQAFHWMDLEATKKEFLRILKPNGRIIICWILSTENTEFLVQYEKFRQNFAVNYKPVKRNNEYNLTKFFEPSPFNKKIFQFKKLFDFDNLKGLLLSISFMPKYQDSHYEQMLAHLQDLFKKYSKNNKVEMEYELVVYWNY